MAVLIKTIKTKFIKLHKDIYEWIDLETKAAILDIKSQIDLIEDFLIKHHKLITSIKIVNHSYTLISVRFKSGLLLEYSIDETLPLIELRNIKTNAEIAVRLDVFYLNKYLLRRRNLRELVFTHGILDKAIPTYIKLKDK